MIATYLSLFGSVIIVKGVPPVSIIIVNPKELRFINNRYSSEQLIIATR